MRLVHRSVCLFAILSLAVLSAQAEPPARYRTGPSQVPDGSGSGKFYMKREIAVVMGHQGAGWLERPEREKQEVPAKLLKTLDLKPGMVVADIGAGSGYYTFRMAEKVGPRGKVLAVDIQKEMLAIIRKRMKAEKRENIELILGAEADPKLPAAAVDLILLVDVYHEFAFPYEMTEAMIKALKPGGRLAFVEFRKEDKDPPVPILEAHKMTKEQLFKEMKPHPLKHLKTISSLPWQHIILFEKKAKEKKDKPAK